ncbi:MAG TPA: TraB/GumN family protein, partial [Chryseosolibacter sp.]|nr:TraB/GumN family protein [Chryseosolibacter sp.]
MRQFFVAITLMVTPFLVVGQKNQRPDYKLFWKIAGKDLARPSYLFGTMHVQDNKAFEFSDSVLLKISECDAFAMEVHPDSVARYMFKILLGSSESDGDRFRELLNERQYANLDSMMRQRTGYSLRKFKNPTSAKLFLENQLTKKDKETFLDAWLYNIAHQQQKIIIGLEETRKHMESLQADPATELREIDHFLKDNKTVMNSYGAMLDLYHAGDIDEIRKISKANIDQARYEKLITKRNVEMVETIRANIHRHSTFIAVGAAHLPGEEGILHLLQQLGYEVTPMAPVFTGLASKYKYTVKESTWIKYRSEDGAYEVDMPSQPFPITQAGLPFRFQAYIDIGGPYFYMATHVPVTGKLMGQSPSTVLDQMVANFKVKRKVESAKKIQVHGLEGREISLTNDQDQFFKVELIHRANLVYLLMAGPTEEFAKSVDARRFFDSFRPVTAVNREATEFSHKAGAFTIQVPGEMTEHNLTPVDPETGEQFLLQLFQTTNAVTGETFLLRYNDFPAGYISTNDSVYYDNIIASVMSKLSGTGLLTREVEVSGFKGVGFSLETTHTIVDGMTVLRGNRNYFALSTRAKGVPGDASKAFLTSLKFLPYLPTPVRQFDTPEGLRLVVPEEFDPQETGKENENGQVQYDILDRTSGIVYMVTTESFSKYNEANSKEEYLALLSMMEETEYDTLLEEKQLEGDGFFGVELLRKSRENNYVTKIKKIVAGDKVYQLYGFLPKDHALSNYTAEFFDAFTITRKSSWNLLEDKTKQMLADLASEDTVTREEALDAIWEHEFEKGDLPMLYKAIQAPYGDDGEFYGSTRSRLLEVLQGVNDQSTVPFIRNLYKSLPDTTSHKDDALAVLTTISTRESLAEMLRLMKEDTTRSRFNSLTFLSRLADSTELAVFILPELVTQHARVNYPSTIFNPLRKAIEQNLLPDSIKTEMIQYVMNLGKKVIAEPVSLLEDDEKYYYNS